MPPAVETHGLTKRFPRPGWLAGLPLPGAADGDTLAVDRVSLTVGRGEIFGLVGPNGAGKTTLVKMLATLIRPTSGTACVNGHDLADEHAIKRSIGLVTANERSFYARLSCRHNLRFYAGLHGLGRSLTDRRIAELSALLGLAPFLDKRFDRCSTGMKHRLALARALLHDPQVLFLDEPTRSLDPLAAGGFRELIYKLAYAGGRTVFLVTHDLEETEALCHRVGLMHAGRLRLIETPERLRAVIRSHERCCLRVRAFSPQSAGRLADLDGVLQVDAREAGPGITRLELRLRDRGRTLASVLGLLGESGAPVDGLEFETGTWEDVVRGLPAAGAGNAEPPHQPAAPATLGGAAQAGGASRVGEPAAGEPARTLVAGLRKPLLFFQRDLRLQLSYRFSFVLQIAGILLAVASFHFVSELLGGQATPYLASYGGDYFSFVLIGIAFAGYQGVALNTFSSIIQRAQTVGTLEAVLTTPTPPATILFSSSLWNFAFTSLRVLAYLLAGAVIFGADLGRANVLAGVVVLGLTILALSGIGILSACFTVVFKRGLPINFLVGGISTLLGGVYYPLDVLPAWLRQVSRLVPLSYSLEGMRRALLAGESLLALGPELAGLAAFSALLLPLSLLALRWAVQQAKRDGSLAQF